MTRRTYHRVLFTVSALSAACWGAALALSVLYLLTVVSR